MAIPFHGGVLCSGWLRATLALAQSATWSVPGPLRLPESCDVYEATREELLFREVAEFPLQLRDKETRILRLEPKP